jgi:hypothetical protein
LGAKRRFEQNGTNDRVVILVVLLVIGILSFWCFVALPGELDTAFCFGIRLRLKRSVWDRGEHDLVPSDGAFIVN